MEHAKEYSVILTTCATIDEAETIALMLVERRLAACVQITNITSYYEWKGKVTSDAEQLLLIKARSDAYQAIEQAITEHHSYEVPEIVQLPIQAGLDKYFSWIDEVSG